MDKILVQQFIQTHTYHPKIDEFYGNIFDTYKIKEIKLLQNLIWQVHKLEISLSDFLQKGGALSLKDFKEKLWPQILRYDFLPVADALNVDLVEWIKKLPPDLQKTLVGKIVTTEKWAGDFVLSQNLEVSAEGRRRLSFLAGEYLRGEKIAEEIKEQLKRPFKVGGLELLTETADRFVVDLVARFDEATKNEEIFTSQRVGEIVITEKSAEKLVAPVVKNLPTTIPPPSIPKTNMAKNIKEDLAELQQSVVTNNLGPAVNDYENQAGLIIKQFGVAIQPDLFQRCKTIIISRLREVRKMGETKERLMAHTLNGGIGFNAELADKLLLLIENFKKKQTAGGAKEMVEPVQEIILKKFPELPVASEMVTEAPKVSPVISTPTIKPVEPVKPAPVVATPPKPLPVAPTNLPFKTPPSSSDIRSAAPVLKITAEKFQPKVQEVRMPVAVKTPITTAIPQTPSGRSKMDDVSYSPRLVGPVEELKEMNLVEFRRLSPKPRVAADRIITKVELLAKEGYDKKLKGIEAWQKSVLNQLYNALLSESLNKAKPVAQVIAEKLTAKQETLSEEEFKVIMDLNRTLRF